MNQKLFSEISNVVDEFFNVQRKSFYEEGCVLALFCENPEAQPREIGEQYHQRFAEDGCRKLTGNGVISILRRCTLTSVCKRTQLLQSSNETANVLLEVANGNGELPTIEFPHDQSKRLILLSFANQCKEIANSKLHKKLMFLNRDFASGCFDSIVALLGRANELNRESMLSEAENEIIRLRSTLERSNKLLRDLQASMDEQVETFKLDAQAEIMSMLNAEKYGYVLDLLSAAQNGFQRMRENRQTVPMDIRNTQTLVRRLLEFVRDCNVTPMCEVGTKIQLNVDMLDEYQYNGTPFANSEDVKTVEVISPGWEIADRSIIISYPRVCEINQEEN